MKTKSAQNVPQVDDDTIKEVVKQRRPKKSELMKPHVNPGDNARFVRHNLELMKWQRPNMQNVEAVRNRITEYFELCEQNDMKPSVEGFALSFGIDRKGMWRWANRVDCSNIPEEVSRMLNIAYSTLNSIMVEYMQNGKINPVSGIFLMKNNMGYTDQTEIVVTPNNPLGAEQSAEDIQKRITDGVIVEIPEE